MTTYRLDLPWPGPLLRENDRPHWAQRARLVRTIRDTTHALAIRDRLPRGLHRVEITLHWQPAVNRVRDANAGSPTLKAAIDGLTDYGLTADDDHTRVLPRCVIEPTGKPAALWLTITDLGDST